MGIRTSREIEVERYVLKVIRGDFADLTEDAETGERAIGTIMEAVTR